VGVSAADALPLVENLPGGLCRAGVLVAKGDATMDLVAAGLDTARAGRRLAEQKPGELR